MYGFGWSWIIVGLIALALFIALVVVVIVIGVSASKGDRRSPASQPGQEAAAAPEDPLEILRRRYARGEITREQYQEMREDLRG
jgi:putative membrane protein